MMLSPKFRLFTLLLISSFILNSCEDLSCSYCYDIKPKEGLLSIEFSPLQKGDSIPITVFKGKLESGSIFLRDTITKSFLDLWVPVDQFYTVEAVYKLDSTLIKAVDGDRVSVYLDETNCSVACWRARDGKADCRLR